MKPRLRLCLGLLGVVGLAAIWLTGGSRPATGQVAVAPADQNGDADGDGFTDAAESLWGSDPGDSRSTPKPTRSLVAHWALDEGAVASGVASGAAHRM